MGDKGPNSCKAKPSAMGFIYCKLTCNWYERAKYDTKVANCTIMTANWLKARLPLEVLVPAIFEHINATQGHSILVLKRFVGPETKEITFL